jgi:hypothetical protein
MKSFAVTATRFRPPPSPDFNTIITGIRLPSFGGQKMQIHKTHIT